MPDPKPRSGRFIVRAPGAIRLGVDEPDGFRPLLPSELKERGIDPRDYDLETGRWLPAPRRT